MQHLGRLIRSASLSGYEELVRSLGRDPHAFMRSVGLQARLLEHPETLIPGDAVRELLEITARATRTEDFALRLAAHRKLSALGPISVVLKEEPTPLAALDTLGRYLKLVNASLIFRLEEAGDMVVIREDLLPSAGLPMRQSIELAVGIMFRILRELTGPSWRPLQVCFTHRPPADLSAHRAFFTRNVRFNQEFNGLVCVAADLRKPRPPGDEGATRFAREYLDAALKNRGEGARESCREMILALLSGGGCTAQEVARHLRVDRRTLARRLGAEGLTFSGLLDQVRSELARRHLRDSDLPLGEVAALLGFSGPSSFSHWFRNHFGCSPSQWSRQADGVVVQDSAAAF
ncbi:AraC family transcriptional regulator [Variovorax sp. J22R133]|uniref:AraC family transcriptional regulator n=1 Tax=Variovorax brevis TaxID=3053503 RepID=UPI00257849D7|nr:AraC family transcriptional regulator [Variovorax sp. J22R133]MDM0112366.1 AraC family transcriptional regulator [Variovorax sp. J22R133]